MSIHVLDAMAREGFELVIALHDRRSRLRGFLGIHDSVQGPAFGGIRRFGYETEDQALLDCLRLARAMTHKCALAKLSAGGGKLVLIDRADTDVAAAYTYVGDVIQSLNGRFHCGPDVGTGARELGLVAARTAAVTRPEPQGPGLLSESTSAGVLHGIAAALRHLDGTEDWRSRTFVVQGLGEVGSRVARGLVERGARVRAAEVDPERAERVSRELEIELVDPATEYDQRCDVFAPCAMGGILHDLTLTRLKCRIVAGGANNVLARTLHGDRLHELGILYAPDFVTNAGALIRGVLFHLEGRREEVESIGERIGRTLTEIFERARDSRVPPARVAFDEAESRIAKWRGERERPSIVR